MPKTVLCPKNLDFQPRPTYPYSPGTKAGHFVFTAGQVAWNETGEVTGLGAAGRVTIGGDTHAIAQARDTITSTLEAVEGQAR